MVIIIGNIVALVASILMIYSGILKHKKKILYVQSLYICLFTLSNLLLNGISGVIINAISLIRNILCYKNKLGFIEKVIISILSIVLILYFNNLGIIGLLPLISAIIYLWLMTIKDVKKFKILIIFTTSLWVIYDFTIMSYTSCIFHILTVLSNAITLSKMKR